MPGGCDQEDRCQIRHEHGKHMLQAERDALPERDGRVETGQRFEGDGPLPLFLGDFRLGFTLVALQLGGDECAFLIFIRAHVGVGCGGVGVVAHSSAVSLFFYCSLCSSIPKRIHAYQRDRRRYACIRCGTGNRLQPVCCVLSVAEFDRPGLGIHRFHDGQ